MKIKICGLRSHRNVEAISELKPDYMGFIFHKNSPRYVDKMSIYTTGMIPAEIKKVGVFVNEQKERIEEYIMTYNLDVIQLHGNESPEFCNYFHKQGLEVIKAFGITIADDFLQCSAFHETCTLFLFDTKTKNHGGSGRKFNWQILDEYQGATAFMLSGGINKDAEEEIKHINHPQFIGVDINSRFESEPGRKDVEKVKEFISQLRNNKNKI
ncbi:MAG: phosphoribosylanthranilate isomerase [Bacteroidales bacterium]|nr:phosphoribosylanthranilate isomerase [Bacteroidales bacterium]